MDGTAPDPSLFTAPMGTVRFRLAVVLGAVVLAAGATSTRAPSVEIALQPVAAGLPA